MAELPQVHLFIPQLFAPLRLWQQDFAFTPSSPALMALLAKYQQQPLAVRGLERTLLHWLGLEVRGQLPWAALRHQFESGGMYDAPLMCADPVCMHTGLDRVAIQSEPPQLPAAETESLLTTLNQHLAQDGLVLKAFHPQRWYLHQLDDSFAHPLPATTPLSEVGNGNVFPCLPQGDKYWQQLFNELQMLLHSHALNQQREADGQRAVNGVWFWGEGEVTTPHPQPLPPQGREGTKATATGALSCIDSGTAKLPAPLVGEGLGKGGRLPGPTIQRCVDNHVQGNSLTAQVLANYCGARWSPDMQAEFSAQHTLVIVDQLQAAALNEQPQHWQAALDELEPYLQPLLEAQRSGACEVVLYDAAGHSWRCLQRKGWFFKGRPAADWDEFTG